MEIRGAGHLYLPKYRKRGESSYKVSRVWWWKRGKIRCSTGCRNKRDAERWALERLVEMGRGNLVGVRSAALSFEDCVQLLRDHYAVEGKPERIQGLAHLEAFFSGWKAAEITPDRVRSYAARRRAVGAAVSTVNVELARLRRMLRLAWQSGRLQQQPVVHELPGAHVRRGFIEPDVFNLILSRMGAKYHPPLQFLRWTGWRLMEALRLEWRRVDMSALEIRLDTSKNNEPRCLAYGGHSGLVGLLEGLWRARGLSQWVFPGGRGGHVQKRALELAWRNARRDVGVGCYIHDLRRTFVRDCERAGVPRSVAMSLTGHTSEKVYRRYAIVSGEDQRQALSRVYGLDTDSGQLKIFSKTP